MYGCIYPEIILIPGSSSRRFLATPPGREVLSAIWPMSGDGRHAHHALLQQENLSFIESAYLLAVRAMGHGDHSGKADGAVGWWCIA
jgi:hypothetical protein